MRRGAQIALFRRIGNKPRFHQDRDHFRLLENRKPGLLHPVPITVQLGHPAHFSQHLAPQVKTASHGTIHAQVRQHAEQGTVVLFLFVDPGHPVGFVGNLGKIAGPGAGGATTGQGKHGGAVGAGIGESIRVDGNKHIGPMILTGNAATLGERYIIIPVTHHHRPHAGLIIDLLFHLLGDLQYQGFLVNAAGPAGPRIFTTMAGINGHHHQPWLAGCFLFLFRFRTGFGSTLQFAVEQIHHQTPAMGLNRFEQVGAGAHSVFHVEDHTGLVAMLAHTNIGNGAAGVIQGVDVETQAGIQQIQHDAIRVGQLVKFVIHRGGQIKHYASVVRGPVQTHRINVGLGKPQAGPEATEQKHKHCGKVFLIVTMRHRPNPGSPFVHGR